MSDESQVLHDLLMTGIHQAMENYSNAGMEEAEAVHAMMLGLAGTVAETMATLAMSFRPRDPAGMKAFYEKFREIVTRMMAEPIVESPPEPVRRITVETRASDEPYIVRTLH